MGIKTFRKSISALMSSMVVLEMGQEAVTESKMLCIDWVFVTSSIEREDAYTLATIKKSTTYNMGIITSTGNLVAYIHSLAGKTHAYTSLTNNNQ